MKESALAALSFIRSNAVDLGVKKDFRRFGYSYPCTGRSHPKDGPSARCNNAHRFNSLLTGTQGQKGSGDDGRNHTAGNGTSSG